LEYTFNADGSLSVRLPANSVSFDESQFNIKQMKVLPYFGAGDLSRDGYVFLPDGSGAVTVFSDFYNSNTKDNASVYLDVYGTDYAYFSLKINKAYTEQVTMPVYGMISTSNANTATEALTGKSETKNGFFAIVEEGSSMSTIALDFQAASFKYGAVYTTFAPYPLDTVPVNGGGLDNTYVKYSDTKFTGSYTTRYVMLSDTDAQEASGSYGYEPTYSGMAHYYREYLKGRGELEALDEINENLPLYIEALGSMEIVKKVLSFPVTTSIPLTTFDNVVTIYDELANAKAKLLKKAEEQEALAEAEDEDLELKNDYLAKAERYRALADELINVTNVNFKLTGFANGGMYFTYPTKVRWEKACGGKKGFASLMSAASERTAGSAAMGIYPDFDFAFISNTAMFDGISNKNTAVKMLDNRYASKQSYNTISRIWESTVAMVVSPNAFDRLYTKFNKQYSKYGMNTISVSTLGSTLNSNMDEKNALPREEALHSVTALLDRINSDGYGIMLERGNAYSLKYADHIIGVSTDSSYYKFSSYSVPFIGMVLHGYMNYAGTPINYTGDPDYDILRAIENGAALYYILCYQNTGFMKDDELLDDYYGVSYENWFDDIVIHYNRVNSVLAKLQKYEIVNHDVLIAERVIGDDEVLVNNRLLASEFITNAEAALAKLIADTYDEMRKDETNVGVGLMVDVDVAALTAIAADMLDMTESELESSGLNAGLNALAMRYEAEYAGIEGKKSFEVVFDTLSYESQYNYVTDSVATDKDNYDYTDYTVDNRLVTIVTYRDAETGDEVQFILNYNIYAVTIRFEDGTVREIGATSFVPLGLE
ncbi:MAG: hypothetical protein IKA64_03540, partial [Clostridia bacterium]|nr:hypothetical protein [Clostridia bacterium]